MTKKCTAIIINFLREPYLFRCIESLKETYPKINFLVAENGKHNKEVEKIVKKYKGKYIRMPYDSGVCVARNKLMDNVKTEYVMIGDDDFEYTKEANVDKMIKLLENNKDIDLVGGRISEGGEVRNYQGFIKQNKGYFIYTRLDLDKCKYKTSEGLRYTPVDLTFNFFVARADKVKQVLWDEKIKVAYEHSNFFIDFINAGNRVVFSPEPIVIHKPVDVVINNKAEYREFRYRRNDRKRFFEKYNLAYSIDMDGTKDYFGREQLDKVDFLIKTFKRRDSLERLLFSIAKFYPDANVYIGDDDKKFDVKHYRALWIRLNEAGMYKNPKAFNLGYDIGLSAGRNFLIKNTPNEYKLLLDDDFVFNNKTDILKFVDVLDNNKNIGVVGGSLTTLGNKAHYEGSLIKKGKTLHHINDMENRKLEEGGFKYCDIVFNFALFRNDLFKELMWDDEIKIGGEHSLFYFQLKNKTLWKVAYCEDIEVEHHPVPDLEYKLFRARKEFMLKIYDKIGVNKIINPNGIVYEKVGDVIRKSRV